MTEAVKGLSLQELADIDQMAAKVIDDWIDSETANVSEFFTDDYAAGNSLKEAVALAITAVASDYAARAEEREKVRNRLKQIAEWADQAINNNGIIVAIRRLEDISDAARALLAAPADGVAE